MAKREPHLIIRHGKGPLPFTAKISHMYFAASATTKAGAIECLLNQVVAHHRAARRKELMAKKKSEYALKAYRVLWEMGAREKLGGGE